MKKIWEIKDFEEKRITKTIECTNNSKTCFSPILFDIIKCTDND